MPRWNHLLVFLAVAIKNSKAQTIGDGIVPNKYFETLIVTSFKLKPLDGNQSEAKFDLATGTRICLTDCFILENISGKYYLRGIVARLSPNPEPLKATIHLDPCSNFTVVVIAFCGSIEKLSKPYKHQPHASCRSDVKEFIPGKKEEKNTNLTETKSEEAMQSKDSNNHTATQSEEDKNYTAIILGSGGATVLLCCVAGLVYWLGCKREEEVVEQEDNGKYRVEGEGDYQEEVIYHDNPYYGAGGEENDQVVK